MIITWPRFFSFASYNTWFFWLTWRTLLQASYKCFVDLHFSPSQCHRQSNQTKRGVGKSVLPWTVRYQNLPNSGFYSWQAVCIQLYFIVLFIVLSRIILYLYYSTELYCVMLRYIIVLWHSIVLCIASLKYAGAYVIECLEYRNTYHIILIDNLQLTHNLYCAETWWKSIYLLSLIPGHTTRWCAMLFPLPFPHVLVFLCFLVLFFCFCVIEIFSCFFFTTKVSTPFRSNLSSSL